MLGKDKIYLWFFGLVAQNYSSRCNSFYGTINVFIHDESKSKSKNFGKTTYSRVQVRNLNKTLLLFSFRNGKKKRVVATLYRQICQ